MKNKARNLIALLLVLLFVSTFFSCTTHRSACPAYGGEAKRFQIERTY